MVRRTVIFSLIFALLGVVIIACQPSSTRATKPTVIIASPPSGSVYSLEEEVFVQSVSTDPAGIISVALLADGENVREDPSPVAQGQAQFSVIQSWKPTAPGEHTLTVRARNSQGATSEAGIIVQVQEGSASVPTVVAIATPAQISTATPLAPDSAATEVPDTPTVPAQPTSPPPPTQPPPCTNNSKYVADLTIPDGTIFTPNAVFTKSWRVQNTGTCPWENYSLVFVSGAQMGAGGVFPVPQTAPGATADLTVPMTAPSNYGSYEGTWRIRNAAGQLFGTNLTVVINVPAPATAVPPTNTPTPTPVGCSGQPNDFTFNASATTITSGQSLTLSWGAVTNASEARLDGGDFNNEGVETPGSRTFAPGSTTEYTLTARCNNSGQTRQKSITITVNAPVGDFSGNWLHNFGTLSITQNGASVTGTYFNAFTGGNGTVAGTVVGNHLTGTWQIGGSGTLEFTLSGDGKRFNGTWNGTNKWCGARPGENFPNGCSFQGNWISDYGEGDCPMTLNRKDNSITGSYCIGTVSGTLSYEGSQAVVSGTYSNIYSVSNTFKFYLFGYNGLQFNGNFNGTTEWCGWRSSSSKPGTCFKP